ncbi:hypothetical protein SCATT_p15310 (plasmid) [Streptantibioticus cattleyicolor NRRL 8057 = DSM 46488]|uniref:Uncharacterized protein n=1 Tax=Streptantibioticus cattleyicolor (strain ATCC 35852 / DSM 46488 / JCM 4925 / NBRC 14057 / NRRL 8057) TaxID=1003195 RepID=F8JKK5_STREN|nr:hypothetical protein SCATT_p15310 [Streptantibioticus cattleyicolor NRRL 8057 = DSM 46488]CCB71236.1 protein of unknown function [Streptantibioticus cattleyicolor NRRL 8057 = DSM 46488]
MLARRRPERSLSADLTPGPDEPAQRLIGNCTLNVASCSLGEGRGGRNDWTGVACDGRDGSDRRRVMRHADSVRRRPLR